ncbi:unnamed protein product [Albugo candida]|nr:unnamed protein product [Albugo candida]|eukprot:CCI39235.1 unnamed protein product [Albugo candida]
MSDIAHKLVKKLEFNSNSTESVEYETKTYSYRVCDEVVYICVTTRTFGKQSAALFLKYINQLFENEFGIRGKATKLALDMNRDFAPTLENQMKIFSTDGGQDKLRALQADMEKVKDNMHQNLQKVLDRGDKIELLVDKSDQLSSQSAAFAESSKSLRRHLWIQNMKMTISIGVFVFICLALLTFYVKNKVH